MYYDLLARIKNAEMAKRGLITSPFSNMDFEIAKILVQSGFIRDAQKKTVHKRDFLEIKIAYKDQAPAIKDFRIFSKPSRKIYFGYRDIKPVRNGYGLAILSTPKGIMSNIEARKNKVGGEYLFQVW